MVVLQRLSDDPYQCGTEVKDVHKIANDEKLVPREWVSADGTYVTNEFISYVRPADPGRCVSGYGRRYPETSVRTEGIKPQIRTDVLFQAAEKSSAACYFLLVFFSGIQ